MAPMEPSATVIGPKAPARPTEPMSALYDPDRRYRRRFWASASRTIVSIVLIILAATLAYRFGGDRSAARLDQLEVEVRQATQRAQELEQTAIRAEAAARAATTQFEDLRTRYEQEVPTGLRREITEMVISQLENGLDRERLLFALRAATAPQTCELSDTRRFIMPTPAYQGANTSVGFAEGRITVTGMAENAVSEEGGTLGWFDPAQEVTVSFTIIGGTTNSISGVLPLHYSVPLDGEEWRFTVTPGDQSFASVTADRCSLEVEDDRE